MGYRQQNGEKPEKRGLPLVIFLKPGSYQGTGFSRAVNAWF